MTQAAIQLNLQQLIGMQREAAELSVRRKFIRSSLSGAHLSRLRGRGMEFDEVRVYQAGDEVSSIDWKVTARKGVTHTKIFREERERPVLICLDYRQNMFFATQGMLKSVLATQAAALLAWHGVAHGDRLGGLLFSDGAEHQEIKPARGRKGVLKFLHRCVNAGVWKKKPAELQAQNISLQAITLRLRRVSKPGSLIYILSDFRGLNDQSTSNLVRLARHNDVILLSVVDSIEKNFPVRGVFPVFDGHEFFTSYANKDLQHRLQAQYQQRADQLAQLQSQHGLQYIELMTHENVSDAIRAHVWVN